MKTIFAFSRPWLLCLLSCLLSLHVWGQDAKVFTPKTVPDPKKTGGGYVSDPGGVLKAADVAELNRLIAAVEDSSTAQIAVAVLPSIGEDSPKEFATALFETWGIGQRETDNGLLILVVMDQRRTEFETGYGLEGVLPDITCYRVGMEALVPWFQQQEYGKGLIAAVARFKELLDNPDSVAEIKAEGKSSDKKSQTGLIVALVIYLLLNLFVHGLLISLAFNALRSKQEIYDKYLYLYKLRHRFWFVLFPVPYFLLYAWLSRKLKVLRYQPRNSRKSGTAMRLLPKEEEHAYLEKGQVTEEEIGVSDYDVWVTESGDDILILRYPAKVFHKYKRCPECRYTTYFLAESHKIRSATYSSTGLMEEIYQCKNCNFQRRKEVILPKLQASSSSSSGSSRGGGSWGGGRSGGGGAGVSW
ncbi:MAG: TPM domain-containing protein [Haliscomenobacter sp.]